MGVFQNNLLAGAAAAATSGASGFYSYQIEQSVRFDSASSSYLSATYSGAGNRRTGTISCWFKRAGSLGVQQCLFNAHVNNGDQDQLLGFTNSDFIHVWMDGGTYGYQVSDGKYRDASGWGHFVVAWDSTQSTSTDRIKLYLNGNQLTTANDSPTQPSQNRQFWTFDDVEHAIGRRTAYGGQNYFNGYLAELIAVDGTAYAPTQFGETKNGVWIPKDPTGTSFGTNGFHLKFENASDLGNDSSGNNHDFTANNMDPDHQVLDSPTFGS